MITTATKIWNGYILETRYDLVGTAAHRNRGAYAGTKIHRLCAEYIVGLVDGADVSPGTFGAKFQETGRPVLFSCYPICGCTSGQTASKPVTNLTAADVTCTKCK